MIKMMLNSNNIQYRNWAFVHVLKSGEKITRGEFTPGLSKVGGLPEGSLSAAPGQP